LNRSFCRLVQLPPQHVPVELQVAPSCAFVYWHWFAVHATAVWHALTAGQSLGAQQVAPATQAPPQHMPPEHSATSCRSR